MTWHKPTLFYLSSGTLNERSAAARLTVVHWLILYAFKFGYDELRAAYRILLKDSELLALTLVQPNVLVKEPGTGYVITVDAAKLGCSYQNLGEAFVDVAMNVELKQLSTVSVSSRNGDHTWHYAPTILKKLLRGVFVQTFPKGVEIDR